MTAAAVIRVRAVASESGAQRFRERRHCRVLMHAFGEHSKRAISPREVISVVRSDFLGRKQFDVANPLGVVKGFVPFLFTVTHALGTGCCEENRE